MTRRWTTLALVASLALNLFLITAGVTASLRGRFEIARTAGRPVLRRAAASLDAVHRTAFIAVLRAEGRATRPAVRQARALRHAAWASLGEKNFEPAVAKASLRRAAVLTQVSRSQVEEAVVDFATTLPITQRAALGGAIERSLPAPPQRR